MISPKHPSSQALLPKSDLNTLPNLLRLRRVFTFKASNLLLPSLEHPSRQVKISPQTLKKYLVKGMPRVTSGVKSLPYYMSHLRGNLRKLTLSARSSGNGSTYNKTQRKMLTGGLAASKQLKSLDIQRKIDLPVLKSIRKLKKLQDLNLIMSHDFLPQCFSIFRGLICLKTLSFHLCTGSSSFIEPQKLNFFYQFLRNLLNLRSLQTLNLKLCSSLQGDLPTIETVLYYVEKLEVPSFNIAATLSERNNFDVNKIKGLLAQIDSISFQKVTTHLTAGRRFPIRELGENQKILNLDLNESPSCDVTPILKECLSLKSLCLSSNTLLLLSGDFKCHKDLKNLVVDLKDVQEDNLMSKAFQKLTSILENVEELDSLFFNISILGGESLAQLKKLQDLPCVKYVKSYGIDKDVQLQRVPASLYVNLWKQLESFSLLESLDLRLEVAQSSSLKTLGETLCYFSKLKYLRIMFQSNYSTFKNTPVTFYIPFEKLPRLSIIHLCFWQSLSQDCAKHLLTNAKSLRKLKELVILYNTLANLDAGEFQDLTKSIMDVEKLGYVRVDCKEKRLKKGEQS